MDGRKGTRSNDDERRGGGGEGEGNEAHKENWSDKIGENHIYNYLRCICWKWVDGKYCKGKEREGYIYI